jgi:hypothetical protein
MPEPTIGNYNLNKPVSYPQWMNSIAIANQEGLKPDMDDANKNFLVGALVNLLLGGTQKVVQNKIATAGDNLPRPVLKQASPTIEQPELPNMPPKTPKKDFAVTGPHLTDMTEGQIVQLAKKSYNDGENVLGNKSPVSATNKDWVEGYKSFKNDEVKRTIARFKEDRAKGVDVSSDEYLNQFGGGPGAMDRINDKFEGIAPKMKKNVTSAERLEKGLGKALEKKLRQVNRNPDIRFDKGNLELGMPEYKSGMDRLLRAAKEVQTNAEGTPNAFSDLGLAVRDFDKARVSSLINNRANFGTITNLKGPLAEADEMLLLQRMSQALRDKLKDRTLPE